MNNINTITQSSYSSIKQLSTGFSSGVRYAQNSVLGIVFLVLSSCGAGVNSSSEELSGDFFYNEKGGDFNYISSHNELDKNIFPKVVGVKSNEDFIIAAQIPNREYHKSLIASHLNDGKKDIGIYLKSADSLLDNSSYYKKIFSSRLNYWIVNNKTHELLGPLTLLEYENMRANLNIPNDLKLPDTF